LWPNQKSNVNSAVLVRAFRDKRKTLGTKPYAKPLMMKRRFDHIDLRVPRLAEVIADDVAALFKQLNIDKAEDEYKGVSKDCCA